MKPITITIPAAVNGSGVQTYSAGGRYFLVSALTGPCRVVTDLGDEYNLNNPGDGWGDPTSKVFRTLTFYNDTGSPITLTFQASMTVVRSPDTNVTSNVNVTSTLTNTLVNCAVAAVVQALVRVAAAGTPVRFAAGGNFARNILVIAQQTLAPADKGGTANTGNVQIGVGTGVQGNQPLELGPGMQYVFTAPEGAKFDLGTFWVDALNNGDGIVIIYW